jgi:hypothetical protein
MDYEEVSPDYYHSTENSIRPWDPVICSTTAATEVNLGITYSPTTVVVTGSLEVLGIVVVELNLFCPGGVAVEALAIIIKVAY